MEKKKELTPSYLLRRHLGARNGRLEEAAALGLDGLVELLHVRLLQRRAVHERLTRLWNGGDDDINQGPQDNLNHQTFKPPRHTYPHPCQHAIGSIEHLSRRRGGREHAEGPATGLHHLLGRGRHRHAARLELRLQLRALGRRAVPDHHVLAVPQEAAHHARAHIAETDEPNLPVGRGHGVRPGGATCSYPRSRQCGTAAAEAGAATDAQEGSHGRRHDEELQAGEKQGGGGSGGGEGRWTHASFGLVGLG